MSTGLDAKFKGCLLGSALGDAIGELAFRFSSKMWLMHTIDEARELRYTDDTAMAIGVAQWLIEAAEADPERLGRIFHRNYLEEPWRGYASGPPNIFSVVESSGSSYTQAAAALFGRKGSFGNGAAMRVAPVGLLFAGSQKLYDHAAASARPTHAHALAADGAALQAHAVGLALELSPEERFPRSEFLESVVRFARTAEFRQKMRLAAELAAAESSPDEVSRVLGRTVAVQESLPFAIYSFATNPDSFEECLLCAILHGGDRDTLGAMAGAVSGAYLGIGNIPSRWLEKLENRQVFEDLASALLNRRMETSGED